MSSVMAGGGQAMAIIVQWVNGRGAQLVYVCPYVWPVATACSTDTC